MSVPAVVDGIGFAAAGLVFATFCMRSMSALRWVAIVSNLAFIAYGYLGNLAPVLLLHLLLLPINIWRLAQLRQRRTGAVLAPYIRAPLRSRSFVRSEGGRAPCPLYADPSLTGNPTSPIPRPDAKGGSSHEQPRAAYDHFWRHRRNVPHVE